MISWGKIEEVVAPKKKNDTYLVRVRVPVFHGVKAGAGYVPTSDIPYARIADTCGIAGSPQVGDEVVVGFYNFDVMQPVVLGWIPGYSSSGYQLTHDLIANLTSLSVRTDASLPKNTKIGDVDSQSIQYLAGLDKNVSEKFKELDTSDKKMYTDLLELRKYTTETLAGRIDTAFTNIATLETNFKEQLADLEAISSTTTSFLSTFSRSLVNVLSSKPVQSGTPILAGCDVLGEDGSVQESGTYPSTAPNIFEISNTSLIPYIGKRIISICQGYASSKEPMKPIVDRTYMDVPQWCAATVCAIYLLSIGKSYGDGGIVWPFQHSASVSYMMWSGYSYSNTPPSEVCYGKYHELFIPKREFLPGGAFNKNGIPDIRPGDIGINKGYYGEKRASHTYYIAGAEVSGTQIRLTTYGGNEGQNYLVKTSGISRSITSISPYAEKFSGIIRPNYGMTSKESWESGQNAEYIIKAKVPSMETIVP